MQHLSTAFLITALTIVVNERVVNAQNVSSADQMAVEAKNKVVTIVEGPKQEKPVQPIQPTKANQTNSPELRPPSKPPIYVTPDKKVFLDVPKHFYNPTQKLKAPPVRHRYTKEQLKQLNPVYKYPNVRAKQRGNRYYTKPHRQPLIFAASSGKPTVAKSPTGKPTIAMNPKYSIRVQTINGIRADFVRPPHFANATTTTSTLAPTTTQRILRTKRIWPKRILDKMNNTLQNTMLKSKKNSNNTATNKTTDLTSTSNRQRIKLVDNDQSTSTPTPEITTRVYRTVTRTSKIKHTTPTNLNRIESTDWLPILPSHYAKQATKLNRHKRSDIFLERQMQEPNSKKVIYLQPYGVLPASESEHKRAHSVPRKNMIFFRKKKKQPTYVIPEESRPRVIYTPSTSQLSYDNPLPQESHNQPNVVTKIKHHHHHHHHRYVKTVEKPVKVPYKVEVPKPYPVEKKVPVPVPVEKIKIVDRPYPVQVEKKIPYPVTVKVPQPIPVKVVEKEYVPKPFPIIHHVPVVKHVEVKVPQPVRVEVEKKVPYPVQVPVPVEKKVPYPFPVEKHVPYPVPVKVYVPQPYPVEKRVPYPVEVKVKEPVEIIKHVHVKVPVLRPYPVKVPQPIPITIEKKVPYPIRVEKKVPYPVEVLVPHKIQVEKRVPVYIPKPYPVEKKVPYPIRVPYPVKVPVKVPVEVPVQVPVYIHHPFQILNHQALSGDGEGQYYTNGASESPYYGEGASENPYYGDGASEGPYYREEENDSIGSEPESVTPSPHHTVTVHGNTGYSGIISRSDSESTTAVASSPKP